MSQTRGKSKRNRFLDSDYRRAVGEGVIDSAQVLQERIVRDYIARSQNTGKVKLIVKDGVKLEPPEWIDVIIDPRDLSQFNSRMINAHTHWARTYYRAYKPPLDVIDGERSD